MTRARDLAYDPAQTWHMTLWLLVVRSCQVNMPEAFRSGDHLDLGDLVAFDREGECAHEPPRRGNGQAWAAGHQRRLHEPGALREGERVLTHRRCSSHQGRGTRPPGAVVSE